MTLEEFKKTYFPKQHVVEITDSEQARGNFVSKTSCCWGNKIYPDTGWAVVCQPSTQHVGDVRTVFVCKASLVEGLK